MAGGNTIGVLYKVTTYGESHGKSVGVVIDGCPPGIKLDLEQIQGELNRRKPGQSSVTSQRKEDDILEITSGLSEEGLTLGTPIHVAISNKDHKPKDYEHLRNIFRPGHGEWGYMQKYGVHDYRGGGRASARETVGRVVAGAVAKQAMPEISIIGYVTQIGQIKANPNLYDLESIESSIMRCPDKEAVSKMIKAVEEAKNNNNSYGGIIEVLCRGVPAGIGEPVFDKLSARLMYAVGSIPAVKGVEIGVGFKSAEMSGKEYQDKMQLEGGEMRWVPNNAGGIVAGISTGDDIIVRAAFKPAGTLVGEEMEFYNYNLQLEKRVLKGRHDSCIVPRAVPIVEAMVAITILDYVLMQKSLK